MEILKSSYVQAYKEMVLECKNAGLGPTETFHKVNESLKSHNLPTIEYHIVRNHYYKKTAKISVV